ncbi:energy transducer TonB [Thiorhodococcus mannitoliphagus]|uniref:Energy transducer TonB n=1 Tax=Thiorhodococcus mannitoliphagus TaxID=329406 RepID=A0A6P1DX67_9GAMM|nr:energy transducer TonB [Thiorhodococcus mannitoliphagus]NEX22279.1 energy transducer TonB [Thiorhodococcus mannitoliphagus]
MIAYAHRLEPPAFLSPPRRSRTQGPFVSALAAAGLLHLMFILAISFVPPEPQPSPESTLEVVIFKEPGETTAHPMPDAALSQISRAGQSVLGDAATTHSVDAPQTPEEEAAPDSLTDTTTSEPALAEDRPTSETSSPLHSTILENDSAEPKVTTSLIPVEKTAPVLTAQTASEMAPVPATQALEETETRVDAAQILASRSLEIARLTASLEARSEAYAKRVRRKSVSASTRELKYASYLGGWARKVERIGNINYPQAAKQERIYGSLILHVAVRSDGSVEHIRVVKSSGYDLLDEAAIQIVELAAPFSPFPPEIAAETDVLDIIRTWQFMRGNVLGWER